MQKKGASLKRALALFGLISIVCVSLLTVRAQPSEPTAIIDAVLRDLSGKLGVTLTRGNVDSYTWEQVQFGDTSLGCPQPGVMYPQVVTLGYHIVVTVNGVAYDYRATNDGKQVFQCTSPSGGTGTTQPASTPVPNAPSLPGTPTTYTSPIAYVGTDGNIYVTQLGGGKGTPITNDAKGPAVQTVFPFYQALHVYNDLRWSSDGSKLAFADTQTNTLYVAASGQPPQIVARGIAANFPPFWVPSTGEVGFAIPTGSGNAVGSTAKFQIQAMPATGGNPRVLGEFDAGTDCGGGELDPAAAAYMMDAGFFGNGIILAPTVSGGYLHSSSCSGIGLGFTSTSGDWQRPDLGRAALSPDGTQLIALRLDPNNLQNGPTGLEKVDLATGQGTALTVKPGIDQIGWADNNTILFSTLTLPTPISPTISQTIGQQLFGTWPLGASVLVKYAVGLWFMPAAGGDSTQLLASDGRGIGMIRATPDGANAVVSFVPSLAAMVSASTADLARQAAPFSQIVVVQMNGQNAAQLAKGGQPALAAGSFSAVAAAPVAVQSNVAPPALVIGGQAVVTTTAGTSLNLRQNPTTTAPVKRLLPTGTLVTILAGPTIAEGLRWWQVRAPDGATGWVADQVTDATGTTNTLAPQ